MHKKCLQLLTNAFALFLLTTSVAVFSYSDAGIIKPDFTHLNLPIKIVDDKNTALQVDNFDIKSKIYGNLVETELLISFHNSKSRNISADFIFPIPANSTINGYALDINGALVDGVIVEKDKGRQVFEAISRQGIDPGLIEKVQGNLFKTRIFPIAANSKRTIQVKYFTVLNHESQQPNRSFYQYQIPLMANQVVGNFSLNIQAFHMDKPPIINSQQLPNADFISWNNAYVAEYEKSNIRLENSISIDVPNLTKASKNQLSIIGKNNNSDYFFNITPKVQQNLTKIERKSINKVRLVWDASHSRKDSNLKLQFSLLDNFFKINPQVEVELYSLRNTLNFIGQFRANQGNWGLLKQALESIQYDGATNISEINNLNLSSDIDVTLFFTDGIHTFAKKQNVKIQSPLYIFNSNLASNHTYMQQLANQSHGQAFSLQNENTTSIATQIGLPTSQLLSIEVKKGQVEELPELPIKIGQGHSISGKLVSNQATLILNYGFNNRVLRSLLVTLNKEDAHETKLPELIWVQQKLSQLNSDKKRNQYRIIELSKKYNIVSDFTSLIVLDNLQQYIQYKIAPPESLAQMRQQYFQHVQNSEKQRASQFNNKIEQVVKLWKQRKQWWNKDFKPKRYPGKDAAKIQAHNVRREFSESESMVVTGSRVQMSPAAEEVASDSIAQKEDTKRKNLSLPTIKIASWDPKTPYLTKLKNTSKGEMLNVYYSLKPSYIGSPAFYFDCANFFFSRGLNEHGLQILSNIAELKIQDSRMLRTMAAKLKQQQYIELSIDTYQQVLEQRPEEPQSFRDLALVLELRADKNNSANAKNDYQQALELLYHVISSNWDRFQGIEVTVLMELNHVLNKAQHYNIDYGFIDQRLRDALQVDVRIVLSWDSDMTDIDLWVIEPNGEKVTYNHKLSSAGGMFHQDFTGGYGPEEYLIRRAPSGEYTIKVHYYGNRSPELSGATTLYVDVYTNYQSDNEQKQTLSLRLDKANDDYLVGSINFEK